MKIHKKGSNNKNYTSCSTNRHLVCSMIRPLTRMHVGQSLSPRKTGVREKAGLIPRACSM